ncbi:MAG TPA: UPF0182 family protein, partial [Pyrinomonadaceae bacterium]|nr:UPF0182 family protein [Pyrinomonadaceae bacterium]
MSQFFSRDPNGEVIDVGETRPRRRRRWIWLVVIAIVLLLIIVSRGLSIYLSALWFGSLGYSSVYWYMFKLKIELFLIFFLLTTAFLLVAFWLIQRVFASASLEKRTILINQQPVSFSPGRLLRQVGWILAIIAGLIFGLGMRESWRSFALYLHQAPTESADPIFNKPIGFYLFTLPVYDAISYWLISLLFIVLIAAVIYAVLAFTQQGLSKAGDMKRARTTGIAAVSVALSAWLAVFGWRFLLARYPYLWGDHQTFSGVNYVEANHLLKAFKWTAIGLFVAALVCLINGFTLKRIRLVLIAIALPLAIYIIGAIIVPAYVTNFVVKPNELGRETPYINHNIAWTRRAFGIDRIEQRNFDALTTTESFDLASNRTTLDNIRLWDWRALKDTLSQIQAIRTYYDFTDVDVDRYLIGGEKRQMMIGTREINVEKLPASSRNWVNEKLIYTHGYGLTMNTANGFDSEGMPKFVLSNMPVESSAVEIK